MYDSELKLCIYGAVALLLLFYLLRVIRQSNIISHIHTEPSHISSFAKVSQLLEETKKQSTILEHGQVIGIYRENRIFLNATALDIQKMASNLQGILILVNESLEEMEDKDAKL